MKIKIEIGNCPSEEESLQVGTEKHEKFGTAECLAFKRQVVRSYPELNEFINSERIKIRLKTNYHDFGSYKEVVLEADEDDEEAVDLIFQIEGDEKGLLQTWDSEALREVSHFMESKKFIYKIPTNVLINEALKRKK